MVWGYKGCEYRPDRCAHDKDDGCEYCCMTCNTDQHFCPECGTVSDHKNSPCNPCTWYCYDCHTEILVGMDHEHPELP